MSITKDSEQVLDSKWKGKYNEIKETEYFSYSNNLGGATG